MAVHVVTICAKRFYHVYVEDDPGQMSDDEIIAKAKENLLQAADPDIMLDQELPMEAEDILGADYEYDLE